MTDLSQKTFDPYKELDRAIVSQAKNIVIGTERNKYRDAWACKILAEEFIRDRNLQFLADC